MPGPGFTRPDLCSVPAAAEQVEPAGAVRGGLSADGHLLTGDDPPAHRASGIDRAIRLSTAAAVLAVAGIAAYVSYGHAYAVVRAHGETGITARLEPATIDGLVYASSMVVLYAARHRVPVPSLARWLLALGIAATFTASTAQGWSHGPVGRWLRPGRRSASSARTNSWSGSSAPSGPTARGPSAVHRSDGAVCHGAVHERDTSDSAWRPAGPAAGQPPILDCGQAADEVLEASAVNDGAVAAHRLSVQAGNPLSERRLAQMFGRTSRRWARARIADARRASPLPDSPSSPVTA